MSDPLPSAVQEPFDLIAVGRISVDLYAREPNASFAEEQTFIKSIGGSPTNVAVAAARLGLRTALATGVGDDELGDYARHRLAGFGVHDGFVRRVAGVPTPLVLASRNPPQEPAILFFRDPAAPDTSLTAGAIPATQVTSCRLLWTSGSALAVGSTAQAMREWMAARQRHGVALDLDYRPALWSSASAARASAREAIALSSIVIGNRDECRMALGTDAPDAAADAMLEQGVQLAVVKMGAEGSLVATVSERARVPTISVEVVCGLGAGDAFGGALSYAILHGMALADALVLANAAGALVASRPTCADDMPSLVQVRDFARMHGRVLGGLPDGE